jgi:hypothetical protein
MNTNIFESYFEWNIFKKSGKENISYSELLDTYVFWVVNRLLVSIELSSWSIHSVLWVSDDSPGTDGNLWNKLSDLLSGVFSSSFCADKSLAGKVSSIDDFCGSSLTVGFWTIFPCSLSTDGFVEFVVVVVVDSKLNGVNFNSLAFCIHAS